jgi:hypothetical protein
MENLEKLEKQIEGKSFLEIDISWRNFLHGTTTLQQLQLWEQIYGYMKFHLMKTVPTLFQLKNNLTYDENKSYNETYEEAIQDEELLLKFFMKWTGEDFDIKDPEIIYNKLTKKTLEFNPEIIKTIIQYLKTNNLVV